MEERARYLWNGYMQGKLTLKERIALGRLIADPAQKELILSLIGEQYPAGSVERGESSAEGLPEAEAFEEVFARIIHETNENARERPGYARVLPLRKWGWVAASLLIVLATGAYWWTTYKKDASPAGAMAKAEIQPGRDGAILTLADGSRVSLDSIRNGAIALQGGVMAKVVDGTLVYEGSSGEAVFNTMSTPKGRQFHMTLPDGSGVWLNAASSIRYPTLFSGTVRRVEVTGEAYFEVKKGALPFVVNADGRAEVTVLGTHFNVNCYSNEATINTTLLEGAVRVASGETQVVISPGEQARVERDASSVTVLPGADLEKVMSWKNGMFNFGGTDFAEAMRQLERWYDIEVVYENGVPALRLAGKMTRGVTLNGLMVVLEELGVRYRLEGRRLVILR